MLDRDHGEVLFSDKEFITKNNHFDALAVSSLYKFIRESFPYLKPEVFYSFNIGSVNESIESIDLSTYPPVDDAGNIVPDTSGMNVSCEMYFKDDRYAEIYVNHEGDVETLYLRGNAKRLSLHHLLQEFTSLPVRLRQELVKRDLAFEVEEFDKHEKRLRAEALLDTMKFSECNDSDGIESKDILTDLDGATYEQIQVLGLEPRFRQLIGEDTEVYYSKAITELRGQGTARSFVLGYVNSRNGWKPTVFYTSLSQGCWRWLPNYYPDEDGSGFLGKGENEHMLTLPPELQDTLNSIAQLGAVCHERSSIKELLENSDIVQQGNPSKNQAVQNLTGELLLGEFQRETLQMNDILSHPDFARPREELVPMESPLYGTIYRDRFTSKDGKYIYSMAHAPNGMAWVQSVVKTEGAIRQIGLVSDVFIESDELVAPAFEYGFQIKPGFRSYLAHYQFTQYEDNFMFVAKHPIVREYYKTIPRDRLEFMKLVPADINPSTSLFLLTLKRAERILFDESYTTQAHQSLYYFADAVQDEDDAFELIRIASDIHDDLKYISTIDVLSSCTDTQTSTAPLPVLAIDAATLPDYVQRRSEQLNRIIKDMQFVLSESTHDLHDASIMYEHYKTPIARNAELVVVRKDGIIIEDRIQKTSL